MSTDKVGRPWTCERIANMLAASTGVGMSDRELLQLVVQARGVDEAHRFGSYRASDLQPVRAAMNHILSGFIPRPGACVMMCALLETELRERHGIPAVCVAGDVTIGGTPTFRCNGPLPTFEADAEPGGSPPAMTLSWDGHCWVELGGLIVEISLLRTARAQPPNSNLRQFVDATFAPRQGAFAIPANDLPPGLQYRRRFVLTDNQVDGFASSEIQRIQLELKASSEGQG